MAIVGLNIGVSFRVGKMCLKKRFRDVFVPGHAHLSNQAMRSKFMTSKRHHNKTSELARKHGTTLIGTLRTHYGRRFAEGIAESETLSDALHKLGAVVNYAVRDFKTGQLEDIVLEGGA